MSLNRAMVIGNLGGDPEAEVSAVRSASRRFLDCETVKKLAALAAGVGIGPLSLRLFAVVGFPTAGPAYDSSAALALWLGSSSVAQFCAAGLVIGGSVVWLAADLAGPGRVHRGGGRPERDRQEAKASA